MAAAGDMVAADMAAEDTAQALADMAAATVGGSAGTAAE
jgi:hypothetical protein